MNNKLKWFLQGLTISFLLGVLVFVAVRWVNLPEQTMRPVIESSSAPTTAVKVVQTIDLTGDWRYEKNGVVFEAKVENATIFITMTYNESTMDYYYGSLANPKGNGEIISIKDDSRISWAQVDTKPFIYQDGSLVFDYKVSGLKSAIELKRVAS